MRGLAHIGREKEVVGGEFEVVATSQDRWLARKDIVGSHLRYRRSDWLGMGPDISLRAFIQVSVGGERLHRARSWDSICSAATGGGLSFANFRRTTSNKVSDANTMSDTDPQKPPMVQYSREDQ